MNSSARNELHIMQNTASTIEYRLNKQTIQLIHAQKQKKLPWAKFKIIYAGQPLLIYHKNGSVPQKIGVLFIKYVQINTTQLKLNISK